jgi:hypothetical protein
MDAETGHSTDNRMTTILRANTWGLTFLVFCLLLDVIYRSAARHEAAWDLLALLIVSGAIQFAYLAWHRALNFNREHLLIVILGILVATIVSFLLAITKAF